LMPAEVTGGIDLWRIRRVNNQGVSIARRALRIAVSLAVIGGVGAACATLPHVHTATAVLALLLTILVIAARWAFVESAAATGLGATLLAYFFLPPKGWQIESVEYWIVLFTFVAVSLSAAQLAARARREASEAVARHRELERLYVFGQDLRTEGTPGAIVAASLESLVRCFQVQAAAFYDSITGAIARSGPKGSVISEAQLRAAIGYSHVTSERTTDTLFVPVLREGQVVGSLAVRGGGMSEASFRAIANRIEAGLGRVYAYEKLRHAEETRKSQELKTALLDSLVHEIKTPLSVIKTAVTSLLSKDTDAASRRELHTIINEECDRLDASISEAFWTARIEAGAFQSGKGPQDFRWLVKETLNELRTLLGSRTVTVDIPDSLPPANCDFHMIKAVVKELLTNALKYSPPDSLVTISVRVVGDEITTEVADSGFGIGPGEENEIFEKHYRGRTGAPGSGLGLAIAKTIVEGHGGRIGVKSQLGVGSVFHFSVPVSHRDAA
jgi:two-component system, OmpR family, sensor histidine kinase KdpD